MSQERMNIRKIAELVGTSHMTVSRALNNSPLVAAETRKRVLNVAAELGYQINAGARGLATGLTTTVGVLYPFHHSREFESWYTSQLMHDLRANLWYLGFDSMIAGYDLTNDDLADVTRLVAQRKVDGVLVIGYEVTVHAMAALRAVTDRYVAVNPPREPWMEGHPAVYVDQRHGGRLAAETLLAAGRTRVAVVTENRPQFAVRTDGFLERWGSDVDAFCLDDGTFETAYELALECWEQLAAYDGLFVGSDLSALGLMSGLLERRVRIPEDVAVVGFDDIEWSRYSRPSLTTVHQPRREAAELAATIVAHAIRGGERINRAPVLAPHIVRRRSC